MGKWLFIMVFMLFGCEVRAKKKLGLSRSKKEMGRNEERAENFSGCVERFPENISIQLWKEAMMLYPKSRLRN